MLFSVVVAVKFELPCEEAYTAFLDKYGKSYNDEGFARFCANYANLQALGDCQDCGIPEHMDLDFKTLLNPVDHLLSTPQQGTAIDCTKYICAASNPLADVPAPLSSIDLREANRMVLAKNQGSCGSCWAFATIAVVQNMVLADQATLKVKQPFWTFNSTNLSLSEQFLISNDFGGDNYCNGGSFARAVNVIAQTFKTVETTANFPYNPTAGQANWNAKKAIAPKIATANYLIPVQVFPNLYDATAAKVASVQLYQATTPFPAATVKTIKSYLSRGLALSVGMYVPDNSPFMYYTTSKGTIQTSACPTPPTTNHAVTLVGFGKKGGKDVWIIQNSWGTNWGDLGCFFIEVGKNAFCLENRAYAAIPKFYTLTSTASITKGNLAYRGKTYGLDKETTKISPIAVFGVAAVALISAIAVAAVAVSRKARKSQGYVVIKNVVV